MKKITFGTRVAYGCGDTACNIVYGMISTLLTLFYTDYAGVSPITIGMVMLISRVFDGSSDLIMGFLVDRTKSRWGKSRPWLLWMTVPYAIAAILMFTVPHTTEFVKGIYIFVTYNLTTTVIYTAINVPYGSLSTMMTRDSYQQDLLSIFRMILSPVGRIISVTFTMPLVKVFGDDQAAWVKTMFIWVAIAVVLLLFCFFQCEETVKVDVKKEKKVSVKKNLKALVTNKYFWCVLGLWSIQVIHQTIVGTDLPYYCKYIFKNDSWMYSTLYFLETAIMILGAMACPFLIKRWGKRNVTLAGSVLAVVSHLLILANPFSFQWFFGVTLIRSIGVSQLSATIFGMLGDVVEYGYWKNGFRQESLIFGGASLGFKVGTGVTSALMTGLMTASGYISSTSGNVVQPGSAVTTIGNIYKIGPVIIWAAAIILLLIYKLDKEYPKISKELAEREMNQA
ncbi:glycoside-pentoside-hexuronide (GPH):cation symporter [Anaerostipes caccae]|uniref:MFS transporter n=1 Tax=Anaerostipes caccae TaxID=105841 RepID=UPI0006C7C0AC